MEKDRPDGLPDLVVVSLIFTGYFPPCRIFWRAAVLESASMIPLLFLPAVFRAVYSYTGMEWRLCYPGRVDFAGNRPIYYPKAAALA
jgi:hypothetical protein